MRYLPLTKNDREEMLNTIGVNDIDELFSNIAEKVSINPKFNLPNHKTEMEVEKHLSLLSDKNLHADNSCLLYTSPSPRDRSVSRMPSSA